MCVSGVLTFFKCNFYHVTRNTIHKDVNKRRRVLYYYSANLFFKTGKVGTDHIKVHYGFDNTARYPGKFPVKFGEKI